jgi:hypothetical protein
VDQGLLVEMVLQADAETLAGLGDQAVATVGLERPKTVAGRPFTSIDRVPARSCSGGVIALYSMKKARGCQGKHQQKNKPTPRRGPVAKLEDPALRCRNGLHFCL